MIDAESRTCDDNLLIVVTITDREREVLKLLARGLSAKQVAQKLEITPRTVESHIDKVRLKTRTRNRTHMIAHAMQTGLVKLETY